MTHTEGALLRNHKLEVCAGLRATLANTGVEVLYVAYAGEDRIVVTYRGPLAVKPAPIPNTFVDYIRVP